MAGLADQLDLESKRKEGIRDSFWESHLSHCANVDIIND